MQMDFSSMHKQVYTSNHRSIANHQNSTYQPSTTATGFPPLAIVLACITAITFMIVSYFLITKCCFPLAQFLMTRTTTSQDSPLVYLTPIWHNTGLDESLIQQIPVCRFNKKDHEKKRLYECVVCLNEFRDLDTLRILPSCDHGFHLHCIDIWLRDNPNCPICRVNILGCPTDTINVPASSPQDPISLAQSGPTSNDQDFVTIELGQHEDVNESRKCCIDVKDEDLVIQALRRSFSMDSAVDCDIYLSIQDVIRNHEEASRTKRPFFSFKHTRGSRSAVLPLEF